MCYFHTTKYSIFVRFYTRLTKYTIHASAACISSYILRVVFTFQCYSVISDTLKERKDVVDRHIVPLMLI